jgi:hypothetical protein
MRPDAWASAAFGGLIAFALGGGCDEGPSEPQEDTGTGINLEETRGDGLDSLDETASAGTGPEVVYRCTEVDFVFVIDNSPSMLDEQQFLVQGVPGFVNALSNAIPGLESLRVGVVDTDSYPGLGTSETPLEGCDPEGETDCGSCDYQLGAFLRRPQSASDPTLDCNFSTGLSYMDGRAESFASEFGCAALVGAVGNPIEQQGGAMVAAMSEERLGAGGCNEGFVRDSALLVFLVISDEEDSYDSPPAPQGGSMGEPYDWYEAVVAAKQGRDANVVALGLLGGSPKFDDCADLSQGVDGAEQSSRLVEFVDSFPTSFVGSVCSDGYGDFLQAALDKVSEGCANFIP